MNTELEQAFTPVVFELLDYNKNLSDFWRPTPEGGKIREFVNRTINISTRQTVYKNGVPIVYRYKANCSSTIIQSEQVLLDKELYGANIPADIEDLNDCKFIEGRLVANKPHLVKYLTSIGDFLGLDKSYKTNKPALYKISNPLKEVEDNDALALDTIDAIQKFRTLSVEDKQAILVKHFGAAYQLPEDARLLTVAISEANNCTAENKGFLSLINGYNVPVAAEGNKVNSERDSIELTLSLLINSGVIDIDTVDGEVSIKGKDGKKNIKLFDFPKDITRDEKVILFVNFLETKDGEATLKVLNTANKK